MCASWWVACVAVRACVRLCTKVLVAWLLDNGFTVEERDNDGNTALLFAAWGGHLATMKLLIDRGANLNEKNDNGHTVLLSASNGMLQF